MRPTIVYKLYAAGTTTTAAAATLTMPRSGVIRSIVAQANLFTATGGSRIVGELSFVNSSQVTTNDTRGEIAEVRSSYNLNTSGTHQGVESVVIPALNIPIAAGDKLYLHLTVTGTPTSGTDVCFFLYIE